MCLLGLSKLLKKLECRLKCAVLAHIERRLGKVRKQFQWYLNLKKKSKAQLSAFLPLLLLQHKKVTLISSFICFQSHMHLTVSTCFHQFSHGLASREDRDELVRSSSHTPANKAQILVMPQFGLRDNLIRCELLKNEEQYTYLEDFRYLTSTRCPLEIFTFIFVWLMFKGTCNGSSFNFTSLSYKIFLFLVFFLKFFF